MYNFDEGAGYCVSTYLVAYIRSRSCICPRNGHDKALFLPPSFILCRTGFNYSKFSVVVPVSSLRSTEGVSTLVHQLFSR